MSSYSSQHQFQQPNYQQPQELPAQPFSHNRRYTYPSQPQPPGQLIPHPQHAHSYTTPQSQAQDNFQVQPRYERQGSHASHYSTHSHHSHHSIASHDSRHPRHKHRDRYDEDDYEIERRPSFGDTLVLMWNSMWAAITGGNSRR